ncbi:UNVERIFIED_CONTAM: hypothetical protein GTU68_041838 [Idotea baltica]|nr:hypothetical protein [Idotea baltica]
MIEIRTNCENCNTPLPTDSIVAMICAFECTFCRNCVETILQNVCPNCGGGFEKRPILRNEYLTKYPPSENNILNPVDPEKFQKKLNKLKDIKPYER